MKELRSTITLFLFAMGVAIELACLVDWLTGIENAQRLITVASIGLAMILVSTLGRPWPFFHTFDKKK